ncbi:YfhO family protein [Sphaerisporangium sp. NPDC051011]|uniref:YfhO family protein n=1 Tax=Sphaerisporangium sp. NPDC051011 TaxID=3155792 RepID=UPI0034054335
MTTQEVHQPPATVSAYQQDRQAGDRSSRLTRWTRLRDRALPWTLVAGPRLQAAFMAGMLALIGLCVGDAVAGFFPFGASTRSVNDLGNQYIPFYAYYWDVLHGHARGDLFVNWASGFGSSYLPDVFYYLASPFSFLIALFPRDQIDLAVYVLTVAKIATAAAVMALYLRCLSVRGRLRSGWAAVFGAAYGLCGWAVTDAAYNPMWLDGLIAFPLLCLAAEWALARRHPVLGTLCVAFTWACNFYTAYFAMIGAAVVLLIRLVSEHRPLRDRLRISGRALLCGGLGVGLAAPIVLVVFSAARDTWPVASRMFISVDAAPLLGRLLAGSYAFSSPALFVGTFALFAALTLPFNPAVPPRVRVAWTVAIMLVLGSMLWEPTVHLWYAFTNPNGSYYRQAFVLCGLLVIAGWKSFSYGVPRPYALVCAAVLLGAAVWGASRWQNATPHMIQWTVVTAAVGAVLYRTLTLVRGRGPAMHHGVAVALLALLATVQTVEAAVNVALVDARRADFLHNYATRGPWPESLRAVVVSADRWPAYRTDPGEPRITANDPQFLGGEGAEYYSSMTSTALIDTLAHLGFGWTSRGRAPKSMDNPVTDTVFAIGARAHSRQVTHPMGLRRAAEPQTEVTLTVRTTAPLVTVRPPSQRPPRYGHSPFRNQELLLGAQVYDLPATTYLRKDGTPLPGNPDGSLQTIPDPVRTPSYPYILRATCRPGDEVYLHAPEFSGAATLAGRDPVSFTGVAGQSRASIQKLGTVPGSGRLKVKLRPYLVSRVPAQALACLDPARLAEAVRHLRATGATRVDVSGHTLKATLPPAATGTAVVAVPAITGWTCSLGPGPRSRPGQYLGLLAIPLNGKETSLTCSFTPPGLGVGLLISGAALLTGGVLYVGRRALRRRRTLPRPAPAT